jgi:hypothetical protein
MTKMNDTERMRWLEQRQQKLATQIAEQKQKLREKSLRRTSAQVRLVGEAVIRLADRFGPEVLRMIRAEIHASAISTTARMVLDETPFAQDPTEEATAENADCNDATD